MGPMCAAGRRRLTKYQGESLTVFTSRGLPDIRISIQNYRLLLDQGKHGILTPPDDKDLQNVLLAVYRGMKPESAGSPGFKVSVVAGDVIRLEKLSSKPRAGLKAREPGPAGKPPVILVRRSEVPAFLAQLDVFTKSRYSAG